MPKPKGYVTPQAVIDKIKKSHIETKIKRESQVCRSFILKLDTSKLTPKKLAFLNGIFLEAKWLYNSVIASEDIWSYNPNQRTIDVKTPNGFESRSYKYLIEQEKTGIYKGIRASIKTLARLKAKGHKVGKLKFKSKLTSIPIEFSFKVHNKNVIKLHKLRFRVNGLDQLPSQSEIATAKLFRRGKDFFLSIATFSDPYQHKSTNKNTKLNHIGIDYGIKTQLTFSNRVKVDYRITQKDKQLRRSQRRISKRKKGSSNRWKAIDRLNVINQKCNHIKKDINNKIVSFLLTNYETVYHQDDNLKGWGRMYGRRILTTRLGGIKSGLLKSPTTSVLVSRWYPSTKTCSNCDAKQHMNLDDRIYECPKCNFKDDRDINSALNIENEGYRTLKESKVIIKVPRGPREVTPVEILTSAERMVSYFRTIPYVSVSWNR